MTAPETYRVADVVEVAFVELEDGEVVRLGSGDALPEEVHPDELARLLNGGVIEGYDAVPSLLDPDPEVTEVDEELLAGNIDAIKLRIGTDAKAARIYLDAERAGKDRPTLVKHLEEVIAADDAPKTSSADATADAEGE